MLRLESGAAFIFMGLRGILNSVLLRLEIGENAVGGGAAGALATVLRDGGSGLPSVAPVRRCGVPSEARARRRGCLERLPVAGAAVCMLHPQWD